MTAASGTGSLTLAHMLSVGGLEAAKVLLIRHPRSHKAVRDAVATGQLLAYTGDQVPNFPTRHAYWLTFLGEEGNSARLAACYRNDGHDGAGHFALVETGILADLVDRLVIDWGPATRSWRQNGATAGNKPVLAILERPAEPFPGFEKLVLSFAQLEQVVSEPRRYAPWLTAMSAVSAVYLIVDTQTGRQYVGSAYGLGGLLGRWRAYVETFHGDNRLMVAELDADPATYERFQFSVLQILPRSTNPDDVIAVEALYKSKLLTKKFGLNAN